MMEESFKANEHQRFNLVINGHPETHHLAPSPIDGQSVASMDSYEQSGEAVPLANVASAFRRSLSTVETYTGRPEEPARLKIVLVGDAGVGKTSLLCAYVDGNVPSGKELPKVYEAYTIELERTGADSVQLALWDTAAQESYSRLRPLSYTNADVILLCYAINSAESLEHIKSNWIIEVRHFCHDIPIILVGLKSDEEEAQEFSSESGINPYTFAKEVNAIAHIRCSAHTKQNVDLLFTEVLRLMMDSQNVEKPHKAPQLLKQIFIKKSQTRKCVIM